MPRPPRVIRILLEMKSKRLNRLRLASGPKDREQSMPVTMEMAVTTIVALRRLMLRSSQRKATIISLTDMMEVSEAVARRCQS